MRKNGSLNKHAIQKPCKLIAFNGRCKAVSLHSTHIRSFLYLSSSILIRPSAIHRIPSPLYFLFCFKYLKSSRLWKNLLILKCFLLASPRLLNYVSFTSSFFFSFYQDYSYLSIINAIGTTKGGKRGQTLSLTIVIPLPRFFFYLFLHFFFKSASAQSLFHPFEHAHGTYTHTLFFNCIFCAKRISYMQHFFHSIKKYISLFWCDAPSKNVHLHTKDAYLSLSLSHFL